MRLYLFLGLTVLLTFQWITANEINNTTDAARWSPNRTKFIDLLGKKLQSVWAKFGVEDNSDSFVGRCFGVARKLKFAMPLILFTLGVIVTVLAFLTIFSLKGLGLLGFLVLLNVSGAISKIAVAFSGKHAESKASTPQNVHFHMHQTKDGNFHLGHTGSGWEDKLDKYGTSNEDLDNVDTSNMYSKLYLNNLLLKNRDYMSK